MLTISISCCIVLLYAQELLVKAQDVPPLLESPLPTLLPTPISPEVEIALRYIAEREGIAPDKLEVAGEEPLTFEFLGKSYIYVTLFHTLPESSQVFSLLVDPITKTVEPDFNAIQASDRAAQYAHYGKLEPALYDRLQKSGDDEEIFVAIWLAHSTTERSMDEIIAAVIARYPEAGKALAEEGIIWDVDDPKLSVEIQVEYERLIAENMAVRGDALVVWLQTEGFTGEATSGMPVVYVKLPKETILATAQREDVARIGAIDGHVEPASDIGVETSRAPTVGHHGYKGGGVRTVMIERLAAALGLVLHLVAPANHLP